MAIMPFHASFQFDLPDRSVRGDPTVVLCAATFHDIGRLDDSGDALHGYRGVPKALAIMDQILEPRERSWDFQAAWDCIKGKVACIVGHHCLPMKGLFFEQKVVMDADKLERYRLGEQNWPDPHRLGLDVSRNLMDWAKQLIMEQGG